VPTWAVVVLALLPSFLTFGVGLIVGYGRASARVAVMEAQIGNLSRQVDRLEKILLYGHPDGGRRRTDAQAR
jgi:hypothetical protein